MIVGNKYLAITNSNYIAGSGDGILTVAGKPATRNIYLMDASNLNILSRIKSQQNGRYVFLDLDVDREYMIMARDDEKEYEPFVWDYVKPATDLTLNKLRAILQ